MRWPTRWPLQPLQPLQKTQLQPPFGPSVSVDSLCHPWFTTTNLSYRFPIFETSATALCGTTGIALHCSHMYIFTQPNASMCAMYAYICGSDCPYFGACGDRFGKPGLQPASTPAVSSVGTRARGMEGHITGIFMSFSCPFILALGTSQSGTCGLSKTFSRSRLWDAEVMVWTNRGPKKPLQWLQEILKQWSSFSLRPPCCPKREPAKWSFQRQ